MKKLTVFAVITMMVIVLASCGRKNTEDFKKFVGTWGVEHIDYYNIDYAGNPIPNTIESYYFTPGDMQSGIDLVFRDDRSGEMRDRSHDTLFIPVVEADTLHHIDTLLCPDTTFVTNFTYSYHEDDATLYMNMQTERPVTYHMLIEEISDERFIYVNEYENNYVEKAWLIRTSTGTRNSKSLKPVRAPHKPGSMFGDR